MIAASITQAGSRPGALSTTLPERYVRIPQRLLSSAVYRPLQVGIYSLAARLFLIYKAPVPLSATDIIRYDPSLSRGAAQRALNSLVEGSWLIATESTGKKTTYVPSWGRVNGAPLPWRIGATCLDRPRHVRAVCLDLRLLDLFLGKLTPQPQRAALITRYVTAPLLALADVGSYALLLGGLPISTPGLVAWGLTRNDQPLPLPDDATILARASQRGLVDGTDTSLTARGLQKVGLVVPSSAADTAQPLFFVPPEVIADWPIQAPTNVIGQHHGAGNGFTALQSQEHGAKASPSGITWESIGSLTNQQESSPNPLSKHLGGGCVSTADENTPRARGAQAAAGAKISKASLPTLVIPKTEAAQALSAINVLPDQVVELADAPITIVNDAIRDGQSRPYVRDLAGWVVTLLRAHRDQGWKIIPPAPRADSPEALRDVFARYAAEQVAEHVEVIDDDQSASPPALFAHTDTHIQLWNDVLATLQHQITRQEFTTWIRPALLHAIEEGLATIVVPNTRVKQAIEGKYRAQLRDLLTLHVGAPVTVRVVLHGAHNAVPSAPPVGNQASIAPPAAQVPYTPDSAAKRRPDWIGAERWGTLPAMLRAALIGSTMEDG